MKVTEEIKRLIKELRETVNKQQLSPRQRVEIARHGTHQMAIPIYLVTPLRSARFCTRNTREFFTNFNMHLKGQILATQIFGHDFVYSAADILNFEAEGVGARVVFSSANSMPEIGDRPLATDQNWRKLRIPDPTCHGRMPDLLYMKNVLKEYLGDIYEFDASGCGPFTLAVHLRGYENLIGDIYSDSGYVHELCEFCVEVCHRFLHTQLELGLNSVRVAEPWGAFPLVNPDIRREFILPYAKALFDRLSCKYKIQTGMYGLSKSTNWQKELESTIGCGVTEILVYEEDLKKIDLEALNALIELHGIQIKVGLSGTHFHPYNSAYAKDLVSYWIAVLGRRGRLGIHVTNLPWHAQSTDIADFVRFIHEKSFS